MWDRHSLIATIITLSVFYGTTAWSQGRTAPVDIDVPLVTQDTSEWCWLAVAEMVSLYRTDQSLMQCEMVGEHDGFSPGWCCVELWRCTRPTDSLAETAEILATAGVRTRRSMALTSTVLYSFLMSDMPVIAQVRNSEGATHAVVIRGLYYIGHSAILIVNDPMRIESREIPYSNLAVGWVNSLIVER